MRKMAQTTANLVGSCLSKSNMTTEGITNEEETPEIHDPVSGSPMTTAGKIHYVEGFGWRQSSRSHPLLPLLPAGYSPRAQGRHPPHSDQQGSSVHRSSHLQYIVLPFLHEGRI